MFIRDKVILIFSIMQTNYKIIFFLASQNNCKNNCKNNCISYVDLQLFLDICIYDNHLFGGSQYKIYHIET